jgi:hypothetical protein
MFTSVSIRTAVALVVVATIGAHLYAQTPAVKKLKVAPQFKLARPGVQNPAGSFESNSGDEPVRSFSTRPGLQNSTGSGGFGEDFQPRSGNRPGLQNAGNGGFGTFDQGPTNVSPFSTRPGLQNDGFGSFDNFSTTAGTGAVVNPLPGVGLHQNPLPQFTHKPIVIFCGHEQPEGIQCTLRGGAFTRTYELQPGEQLRLKDSRAWTIDFHRGGPFGEGKYRLIAGLYTFRGTENGWELFRARQK